VTECIPDIISFIRDLIQQGHAYEAAGDVYFDTSSFAEYGKLSGQSVEEMRSGFRIGVSEQKDDPSDFALWKSAKPSEESWDSPWGPGRPGWHIECSVMNAKYLGEEIDIHAGGRDLLFPHHENEIAQSEAHSHHVFARYWMHNGTLNINGEKMSKSLGNFIMTNDLLAERQPRVVRLFLLATQYRHPLNYTEDALGQAEQSLERIDRALTNLGHRYDGLVQAPHYLVASLPDDTTTVAEQVANVKSAFVEAMDDDFNTADGIAALFEGVRLANTYLAQEQVTPDGLEQWRGLLQELMKVLGIEAAGAATLLEADILAEIEARNKARARRDFQEADRIRDELAERGIVLEDTPQGTRWTRS
jgi:cysteinyl-tRNA synthetase